MKKWLPILCTCLLSAGLFAGDLNLTRDRAFLGVMTQPNDGDGVLVSRVVPESAAALAGVLEGDVIVDLNGTPVNSHRDLVKALGDFAPGDTVTLNIQRDKDTLDLTANLGDQPARRMPPLFNVQRPYVGIQMETLNPELADFFNVEGGVLIKKVMADSPAEKAGLQAGDVILTLAAQATVTTEDIFKALADLKSGDTIDVVIQRHEKTQTLSLELGSSTERPFNGRLWRHGIQNMDLLDGMGKQ